MWKETHLRHILLYVHSERSNIPVLTMIENKEKKIMVRIP